MIGLPGRGGAERSSIVAPPLAPSQLPGGTLLAPIWTIEMDGTLKEKKNPDMVRSLVIAVLGRYRQ